MGVDEITHQTFLGDYSAFWWSYVRTRLSWSGEGPVGYCSVVPTEDGSVGAGSGTVRWPRALLREGSRVSQLTGTLLVPFLLKVRCEGKKARYVATMNTSGCKGHWLKAVDDWLCLPGHRPCSEPGVGVLWEAVRSGCTESWWGMWSVGPEVVPGAEGVYWEVARELERLGRFRGAALGAVIQKGRLWVRSDAAGASCKWEAVCLRQSEDNGAVEVVPWEENHPMVLAASQFGA